MPWIKTIPYEQAEGELKSLYDHLIQSRGKLAEVHKIQSLNPKALQRHMELYMELLYGSSPLRRYQRELLGVVTSAKNCCSYCVQHHAAALLHFWKEKEKVQQVIQGHYGSLAPIDRLLCLYAEELTLQPFSPRVYEIVQQMKEQGHSDRAILDSAQIIAYFNFVNRLVLGLGVELEPDGGTGYFYD